MKITKTLRTTIFAIAIVGPLAAHAGGLYLYEIATSDLGFAAAGTAARAEDASTVYANPAGMTRLTGDQLTVGGQLLYGKADYELNQGNVLPGSNPGNSIGWLPNASIFYSHSVSDQLKLGLATYGNFGLAEDFGSSWAGRKLVDKTALMALTIQPTIAYRFNEQWSFGAGLTANYGYLSLEREALLGRQTQKSSDGDWGFGARIGVLFEPSKSTRVGVVYNSEADLSFDIDKTVTIGNRTHSIPFGADVTMPQQVMTSVYHQLDDRWAMMGNVGWQNWSQFADATLETNLGTATSSLQLQDTWHVAYGVQYTLDPQTKLNGGIAYDSSMYKNQSQTSFALPNGDTWRFGAGVQRALSPKESLGFAAEYLYADSSADPSALIGGSYNHPQMFVMSVNYTYQF